MAKWKFDDRSTSAKAAIESAIRAGLEEAGGEFEAQAIRNTRVDTSDTKKSFGHTVSGQSVVVGSNAENAIWEEYGTGIYAEKGDGRKKPWVYKDRHGNFYKTSGKKGTKALTKAMKSKAEAAKAIMKAKLGAIK